MSTIFSIVFTEKLRQDVQKAVRNGDLNVDRFKDLVEKMGYGEPLDVYHESAFLDLRRCLVGPDLWLVYKLENAEVALVCLFAGQ